MQATTPIGWRNVKSNPPRATGSVWPPNLEHARAQPGLVARIGDRLADVQGLELGQPFQVLPQDARDSVEGVAAFARTQIAPAGLPGALGRLDGLVHVRKIGCRDRAERFLGRGIDEGSSLAGSAFAGGAIDEEL
ncbi:MAG: hypothetical protein ABSH34_33265 [Verrucomicrobiota bacterium]